METLTLENICPYTPGLKALKTTSDKPYMVNITGSITDDDGKDFLFYSSLENNETGNCETICFKLILKSMNLTTPITVDGKEIIPIVELAKIAFPEEDWRKPNGVFYYATARNSYPKIPIEFSYVKGFKAFKDHCHFDAQPAFIPNQLALFQWLYKHKFDVDGLIEKGIAIDVNTLDVNPYNT